VSINLIHQVRDNELANEPAVEIESLEIIGEGHGTESNDRQRSLWVPS
jgi:hypothetical protein